MYIHIRMNVHNAINYPIKEVDTLNSPHYSAIIVITQNKHNVMLVKVSTKWTKAASVK